MFDIAWSEMALIGAVALVVIGPKDLPKVMRQMGRWSRKLRLLAGEFQRNMDEMVREAELDEVKRQIQKVGETDIKREVERTIDPTGSVERALRIEDGPELARIPTEAPAAVDPPAAPSNPTTLPPTTPPGPPPGQSDGPKP
jgi:sec-independent protein translocase protein TatB